MCAGDEAAKQGHRGVRGQGQPAGLDCCLVLLPREEGLCRHGCVQQVSTHLFHFFQLSLHVVHATRESKKALIPGAKSKVREFSQRMGLVIVSNASIAEAILISVSFHDLNVLRGECFTTGASRYPLRLEWGRQRSTTKRDA